MEILVVNKFCEWMKQSREGVVAYLYRISGLHRMYVQFYEWKNRLRFDLRMILKSERAEAGVLKNFSLAGFV
jgi:hypothetical protein